MSAVRAMEDACGVAIDAGPLRDLRRLIYCGEWIESHSLHVYMLHAPDFLGYAGAVEMARDHREIVEQGLQMKKAGNALMALVGGREVHPINVRVGGFYRAPDARRAAHAASTRSSARARRRSRPSAGRRRCRSPRSSARPSCVALSEPGRLPDRPRSHRLRPRPATSRPRSSTSTSSRSTSSTPTRCTPASASAAPT